MTAMPRRWVIGRGLFGQAVVRSRGDVPFATTVPWSDGDAATDALRAGLATFVDDAPRGGPLEIIWAAGRAVTSTPRDRVFEEVAVFRGFIDALSELPPDTRSRLTVGLASSVGGAYAASSHPPFTEHTRVAPGSPYGEGKLAMEDALRDGAARGGWHALIGRLTNLYGPGQDMSKGQGLISVLVRAHITGIPASIYVPLDTLRDYVYEDDAANVMSAAALRAAQTAPGTTTIKIIGSGAAVSIGALISELHRLRRRRGRIVLGGGSARGQSLDLRVRSRVWPDLDGLVRTTLPEGLSRVYAAQLSALSLQARAD